MVQFEPKTTPTARADVTAQTELSSKDLDLLADDSKICLTALAGPDRPLITLVAPLVAPTPTELAWADFSPPGAAQGLPAGHKLGFLIIHGGKQIWLGRGVWNGLDHDGPVMERLAEQPALKANPNVTLTGAHRVGLVDFTGPVKMPITDIGLTALMTKWSRRGLDRTGRAVLTPDQRAVLDKTGSLKFLAWADQDGFPRLVPIIQALAVDDGRLAFSTAVFVPELKELTDGARVTIYVISTDNNRFTLTGRFIGRRRKRLVKLGVIDLD